MGRLHLILGGARSGKSDYGERLAADTADEVLFIATAQAFDDEMRIRIDNHRAQRPGHWATLEAPSGVTVAFRGRGDGRAPAVVLLDCLTLLVSNLLLAHGDNPHAAASQAAAAQTAVDAELDELLDLIKTDPADWIIISNEVGWGIVPANKLSRIYRDILGRANQRLAAVADEVTLMVAGLPLPVKRGREGHKD